MPGLLQRQRIGEQILAGVNAMLTARGLMLQAGTVIDATIIAAPSSTKNKEGKRDPEMHQTKKGNQWHFGMKMHIGADADSGLVHTPVGTAANVHDITQAVHLLHGQESDVHADSGFRGVHKRPEIIKTHPDVNWHVAMTPGKRRALDKDSLVGELTDALERTKAGIRAKVSISETSTLQAKWAPAGEKTGDMMFTSWGNGSLDPSDIFVPTLRTGGRGNRAFYSNKDVDALLDRADVELDRTKRADLYKKAQSIVNSEAPWIFMWLPQDIYGVSKRVSGWEPSADSRINLHDVCVK